MQRGKRKGTYFSARLGKELSFRHSQAASWEAVTRLSNMNIDFEWWEKGCKSVVGSKVSREKLVDEYLGFVQYAYKLSDGQVRILRAIYDCRKWWGVFEMTDDFEVEMCGIVKLSRRLVRDFIRSLAVYKGLLKRVKLSGKYGKTKYMAKWDVLVTPMEMKNCEFVMMSFKMQVEDMV